MLKCFSVLISHQSHLFSPGIITESLDTVEIIHERLLWLRKIVE